MATLPYRKEIDGLRSIAVLSVLIYHAEFQFFGLKCLPGGFLGVDIFFVISGYLISRLLLKELHENGSIRLFDFWERRARRILPAFAVVVIVTIGLGAVCLSPSSLIDLTNSALSSLAFVSNFFFYFDQTQYGAANAADVPLLHTWSLSVEEQFYVFFPILLIAITTWSSRLLLPLLVLLLLISLQTSLTIGKADPDLNFFFTFSRIWELLVGFLVAYVGLKKWIPRHPALEQVFPVVGIYLIGFAIFGFSDRMSLPGLGTIIPIMGVSLLLLYSSKDEMVGYVLSSRLPVAIGVISYSLYLWHFPIISYARLDESFGSNADKAFWMIVALAFSILTYFFIEQPFRRRTFIRTKFLMLLLGIPLTGILFAGLLTNLNDGFPERFSKVLTEEMYERDRQKVKYLTKQGVLYGGVESKKVVIEDLNDANRIVLLIGDSFSSQWSILYQHIDLDRFQFLKLDYRGCELEFGKKIRLANKTDDPNYPKCEKLLLLNQEAVLNNISHIVVASNAPLKRGKQKFELIDQISKNLVIEPTVLVLGNYVQPKINCLDLMAYRRSSAEVCITSGTNGSGVIDHSKERDGNYGYYLLDKNYFFVSLFEALKDEAPNGYPYSADGVPFVFDRSHLRPSFISFILQSVVDYTGEDPGVLELRKILASY
ncbi:MAG: acyltransferase [Pseudomonadota bacterium]|nr:acyltransferase [Pseudomonadota bacterium]